MLFQYIKLLLCGLAGGVTAGMGMGGGTLLIPLLSAFCGMSQRESQGANLLAYLFSGGIAYIVYAKSGTADKKTSLTLLLWGIPGAIAGTLAALALDTALLRRVFGAFIIAMALWQLYLSNKRADGGE